VLGSAITKNLDGGCHGEKKGREEVVVFTKQRYEEKPGGRERRGAIKKKRITYITSKT